MSSVYKLLVTAERANCKNFVSEISFLIGGFKLGLYSVIMASLCRNLLQ